MHAWHEHAPLAGHLPSPLPTLQYDGAGIIPNERQEKLSSTLGEFEKSTGWRVRVLTYSDPSAAPGETQIRAAWQPDKRSVIVQFDPSSPNIIAFPYM